MPAMLLWLGPREGHRAQGALLQAMGVGAGHARDAFWSDRANGIAPMGRS